MNPTSDRGLKNTVDWRIVICYVCIVLFGIVNIYASIQSSDPAGIWDLHNKSGKQLLWFGISLVVATIILFAVNPRLWEVISTPGYIVVFLLLIFVIFLGSVTNGSKSWFELGPIKFQPCEISKITTSLLLAAYMSRPAFKITRFKDLCGVMVILGLPALAILAEKETGTVLVYGGFLFALYREGLTGWILGIIGLAIFFFVLTLITSPLTSVIVFGSLILILGGQSFWKNRLSRRERSNTVIRSILALAVGVGFIFSTQFVYDHVLQEHQQKRIAVLLGLKDDPMGAGYNVRQAKIAIGSGGFNGKGYLQGTQTAYGFVPEQSTDFIFCTVGEEWGFVGCFGLIVAYCLLIFWIIQDADQSRETFTRIFGYCTASCFFMHLMINVGMTIGLTPVIGIPLPLMSYGGSSLLAFTIMIFIFIALDRQEKKYF